VKVLLTDSDEALRAGMSVRAEIHTAAHPDSLVVPIQAVVERPPMPAAGSLPAEKAEKAEKGNRQASSGGGGGEDQEVKVVFVIEGNKARQRTVETGLSDETHVELRTGAKPGEKVVTGPYRTLRDLKDGDTVTVSKTSEATDRRADRQRDKDDETAEQEE
jgi:HlyD family secretion protein